MTLLRMQRLDETGAPVGEPVEFEGTVSWEPLPPIEEPCATVLRVSRPRTVSFTARIVSPKTLTRLLLGPRLALKQQRAERHRARIVVVPKRRRKHGRVGVYR